MNVMEHRVSDNYNTKTLPGPSSIVARVNICSCTAVLSSIVYSIV